MNQEKSNASKNSSDYAFSRERAVTALMDKDIGLLINLLKKDTHPGENTFWASAIFQALFQKQYDVLEALLKNGVNPNTIHQVSKHSLLLQACIYNNIKAATLLIKYQANPILGSQAYADKKVLSAYQYAIKYKKLLFVRLFIENKPALFFDSIHTDNGDTLLHIIAGEYHGLLPLLPIIVQSGANLNFSNKAGNTPLHFAMGVQDINVAKTIIEIFFLWEADFEAHNKENKTPFQCVPINNRNVIASYYKQLLAKEEYIKNKLYLSPEKNVRVYLRLLKCLSFHQNPETIKRQIFFMLDATRLGLEYNKIVYLPPELAVIILQHYFRLLDATIDSPYKFAKFSVEAVLSVLEKKFLKIAEYYKKQNTLDTPSLAIALS